MMNCSKKTNCYSKKNAWEVEVEVGGAGGLGTLRPLEASLYMVEIRLGNVTFVGPLVRADEVSECTVTFKNGRTVVLRLGTNSSGGAGVP